MTAAGSWREDVSYPALTIVVYDALAGDGCGYVSLKNNLGVVPGSDADTWKKVAEAGRSIYQLCVDHGTFEGSEEEFVAAYNAAVKAAGAAADTVAELVSSVNGIMTGYASAMEEYAAAESARNRAELARVGAETARAGAESARQAAESVREQNESARQTAETSRANTFVTQMEAVTTATGLADAATAAAQNAAASANSAAEAATEAAEEASSVPDALRGLLSWVSDVLEVAVPQALAQQQAEIDGLKADLAAAREALARNVTLLFEGTPSASNAPTNWEEACPGKAWCGYPVYPEQRGYDVTNKKWYLAPPALNGSVSDWIALN